MTFPMASVQHGQHGQHSHGAQALTPRERGVLLAMLGEDSFTFEELADLTGLTRSHLGKIKFELERKAPGLLYVRERRVRTGPGPRVVVWQVVREVALRHLGEVPHAAAAPMPRLPGLTECEQLAAEIADSLAYASAELDPGVRFALCRKVDYAEELVARAVRLRERLSAEGRVAADDDAILCLTKALDKARAELRRHAQGEIRRIDARRRELAGLLRDPAGGQGERQRSAMIRSICATIPGAAPVRLQDIASMMAVMADAPADVDGQRLFRECFDDDQFRDTATEALCEVVLSAGDAPDFVPLADTMMDAMGAYMPASDNRYARRLLAAAEHPRLTPAFRETVRRAGAMFLTVGETCAGMPAPFDFAPTIIAQLERMTGGATAQSQPAQW